MEQDNITFEQGREAFLNYCRVRNLSPATLIWYKFRLGAAFNFFEREYPDMRPNEITITELRALVTSLIDTASKTTVNHTITATKSFFNFLTEEGYLEKNPTQRLEKIKAPRTLIQPFSVEQIAALLQQPNKRRFSGVRDYAMLVILFDCGLRLSEILGLTMQDVNFQQNTLKVMGKGSKERVVPFGKNARLALQQYLDRRGTIKDCDTVFVSELGEPLCSRVFQDSMKRYGHDAKIAGVRVSPHTCRHTFAVNWIRNHGDVFTLQRLLGHSTLDICRLYVNLVTDDLQKAHQIYSPMDHMLGEVKQTTGRKRLK